MRTPLPIDGELPRIVDALRGSRAAVVVAPPGSGKTTRIPPALLDSIPGRILVLEPRRVATRAAPPPQGAPRRGNERRPGG